MQVYITQRVSLTAARITEIHMIEINGAVKYFCYGQRR